MNIQELKNAFNNGKSLKDIASSITRYKIAVVILGDVTRYAIIDTSLNDRLESTHLYTSKGLASREVRRLCKNIVLEDVFHNATTKDISSDLLIEIEEEFHVYVGDRIKEDVKHGLSRPVIIEINQCDLSVFINSK